MDQHDELSLACAACDLSARLRGDLRREQSCLALSRGQITTSGDIDQQRGLRLTIRLQRANIIALRRVLAGVTTCYGECHATCVA